MVNADAVRLQHMIDAAQKQLPSQISEREKISIATKCCLLLSFG